MSRVFVLLGAFDRYNYGDLLYPILLERVLREKYQSAEIYPCGLIDANMEPYGGKKVERIFRFTKKKISGQDIHVLIGGGDVLGVDCYYVCLCLIGSPLWRQVVKSISKIVGKKIITFVLKRILKIKTNIPFIYSPADFGGQAKLYYISVGGQIPKNVESIAGVKLKNAEYFWVREPRTEERLQNIVGGSMVKLAPDLATLLSDFFPRESLVCRAPNAVKLRNKMGFDKKYICFQVGHSFGSGFENILIKQIQNICDEFSACIVLVPIGWAPMHDDFMCLSRIKRALPTQDVVLVEAPCTIWDIAFLISHGCLFIGSSLHGCITAQSYGVPFIGMPETNRKLAVYLKAWQTTEEFNSCCSFGDIADRAKKIMSSSQAEMINSQKRLSGLVKSELNKFAELLDT